jgi:hypothetical protein
MAIQHIEETANILGLWFVHIRVKDRKIFCGQHTNYVQTIPSQ